MVTEGRLVPSDELIYIPDSWVRAHLSVDEAIAAVERVFRWSGERKAFLSDPSAMALAHPQEAPRWASVKVKGALLEPDGVAGLRLIGDGAAAPGPANREQHSYCWLVDGRSSRPLALIDEDWQHLLRTGVTGAVAMKYLAKPGAGRVGIVGAGRIARTTLMALERFFKLEEVKVTSARAASREAFAEEMSAMLPVRVVAVPTPRDAVEGVDMAFTITDADEVLIHPSWLPAGATVCSLGGNQELDPGFLSWADKFVVDDPVWCKMAGDVRAWIARGHWREADIDGKTYATIGEIVAGRKAGREGAGERIVAVIQGMASCDLALAKLVYDKARTDPSLQRLVLR